jgi:hypothetical protein
MAGARPGKQGQWPLKLFKQVLAAGLFIALSNPRVRGTIGLTLAAGMLLPALLLLA